jgi:hypothetical protein
MTGGWIAGIGRGSTANQPHWPLEKEIALSLGKESGAMPPMTPRSDEKVSLICVKLWMEKNKGLKKGW